MRKAFGGYLYQEKRPLQENYDQLYAPLADEWEKYCYFCFIQSKLDEITFAQLFDQLFVDILKGIHCRKDFLSASKTTEDLSEQLIKVHKPWFHKTASK